MAFARSACNTHCHSKVSGYLRFDISTYIIAVIVEIINITFLSHIAGRGIITHFIGPSLNGNIMFLIETCTKYLIDIVNITPAIRTCQHVFHILFGEDRSIFVYICNDPVSHFIHHITQIIIVSELRTIHEFREISIHRSTERSVISNFGFTFRTFLRCYNNNTTGSFQPIYSCRSCVFQNRNTLYIIGVDVGNRTGESVHNIDSIINRATNTQGSIIQSRFTGFLYRRNTGQFTC